MFSFIQNLIDFTVASAAPTMAASAAPELFDEVNEDLLLLAVKAAGLPWSNSFTTQPTWAAAEVLEAYQRYHTYIPWSPEGFLNYADHTLLTMTKADTITVVFNGRKEFKHHASYGPYHVYKY